MSVTTAELWAASKLEVQALAPSNTSAGISVGETHPADPDYVPPVTRVKLPSKGLVYPTESPLFLCDHLDITPVSAKEENILASATLIKNGTVLSTLMRACVTNRLVDPEQMLPGDRNAVLTAIRVSAYGPAYTVNMTCPECLEVVEHSFDLSRLSLKTLDHEPTGGPGNNEFAFTLPVSGRGCRFRLLTADALNALTKDMEGIRKKTGLEQGVTLRLRAQVTQLDGVTDSKKLPAALEAMAARDARALRSYMDDVAPGVDMRQDFECTLCGKTSEVDIPVGTEFFWPSK